MYLRSRLVRFYHFSDADFDAMSFEQFLGYIENIPEIQRIEAGRELTNEERVERQMKRTEEAIKKKKKNAI